MTGSDQQVITSKHVSIINRYILGFMKLNKVNNEIIDDWLSKENQNRFKSSMTKMRVNHSKRGKTIYICFCDEERPQVYKEFPNMNIKEITCEMARRWSIFKENPDEDRLNRLTELSKKSNEEYRKSKTLVNSVQPPKKKVSSSYINFSQAQRKITPKITMKEIGELWRKAKENGEAKKYMITKE